MFRRWNFQSLSISNCQAFRLSNFEIFKLSSFKLSKIEGVKFCVSQGGGGVGGSGAAVEFELGGDHIAAIRMHVLDCRHHERRLVQRSLQEVPLKCKGSGDSASMEFSEHSACGCVQNMRVGVGACGTSCACGYVRNIVCV